MNKNETQSNKNNYFPFIAWFMGSVLLMVILKSSDFLVFGLEPFANRVLSLVASWNQAWPFNTPSARVHTAIFILLIPVQIVTLYKIPRDHFLVEPQKKGPGRLLGMMILLGLVPIFAYTWGLSLAGAYKFLGNSLGVAAVVFIVTMCISSIARAVPIYIEMLSERK